MGTRQKPWSKAKIQRVIESVHAGGFAAYRSHRGWHVWLSGPGAQPTRRRFFLPEKAVSPHHARWLGNRLIAAMHKALDGLEGAQQITGAEARDLVRWCTRWSRHHPQLTAGERARAAMARRWLKKTWRVPQTVQGGQYLAERSRRGWVVRLSSYSGRVRGHYLVPFRALRPHGRNWNGRALVSSLARSLAAIVGAQTADDFRFPSPTWHVHSKGHPMPIADC